MSEEKRAALEGVKKVETVPERFIWNSQLMTGLEAIDDQHKKLVRLINELYAAMKSKAGAAESGRMLEESTEYTKYHFEFEEKMFSQHNYPEATHHKAAHRALVDKVVVFKTDFKRGKAGLSMELMDFLSDWLRQHIMKTDKAYVPFFKGKNLK